MANRIEPMKILLVDEHVLFRAGLRMLLQTICPDVMVLEAYTLVEALSLATDHPDLQLCLLGISLKAENGLTGLTKLRETVTDMPIVMISGTEDNPTLSKSIDAGAMSFIPKSATPKVLAEVLNSALGSSVYLPEQELVSDDDALTPPALSARQHDVLRCLSRGLQNKQIARELQLSDHTVKEYMGAMFKVLGVHSRTEAVITASRLGLIEDIQSVQLG